MKNAVGRDIPESVLALGYEPYKGANHRDGQYIKKQGPRTRICEKPQESKIVDTIADALRHCGAKTKDAEECCGLHGSVLLVVVIIYRNYTTK